MQLPQDDINKYKPLYLQTARKYLESMQTQITKLLNNQQKEDATKQIHIDAHSLKSQSQVMGYNHISKISEIIEHIFNKSEKENTQVDPNTLTKIQKALPKLSDSMTQIENTGKELDLTTTINELEKE